MHAAMHVGAVVHVKAKNRINHFGRLLAGGRVVEIDERLPVHLLFQNREILPNPLHIEGGTG
jgi:hypothetical protein